jgi:hypothetical protein
MGSHKKIERKRELDRQRRRRKKSLKIRAKSLRQSAKPAAKKGH